MPDNVDEKDTATQLRREAERRLTEQTDEMRDPSQLSPEETRRLLHELRVHQIELEMQNEELRRAQKDLQAARDRYADLYDFAPAGYVTIDEKSMMLEANLTATRLLDVPRSDLIGKPLTRFILAEDQDIHYLNSKTLFDTGDPQVWELRLRGRDETPFWVEIQGTLAHDGDGAPVCRCAITDITERKQAEEALRANDHHMRMVLESTADGILAVDALGKTKHTNRRFAEMWRIPSDLIETGSDNDMLNHVLKQLADPEAFLAKVKQLYGNLEEDFDMLTFKDGRVFERFSCPLTKDGKLNGRVWSFRDITERKQAEEALRESEEKYRAILESIEDGYFEVDIAGNFTFFNGSLCEILGYSKDELTGMNNRQYTDKENTKKLFQAFNKVYTTGKPDKGFDWEIIRKDGTKRSIEASVSLRRDAEGVPTGFRGVVRDISEKQRLEAQIRQAQKMEGIATLTGGIAHDYNNLLSIIVGNLGLAQQDAETASDQAGFLHEAEKAARKVGDLTHELMALSRGGGPIKELGSIRESLKDSADVIPADSGITVNVSIQEDLWPVPHDSRKMASVFRNVVQNALEAMPKGGFLTLDAQNLRVEEGDEVPGLSVRPGDYVGISIQDNGIGISKENLDKVFDPYFSTKAMGTQKGMGLGLATAHAIVKKHGEISSLSQRLMWGPRYISTCRPQAQRAKRKAQSVTMKPAPNRQSPIINRQSRGFC